MIIGYFCFILCMSILDLTSDAKKIRPIIFFICVLWGAFIAATNTTGTDYLSYTQIFNDINEKAPYTRMGHTEFGFQFSIYWAKRAGLSFTQFLFTYQLIALAILLVAFQKLSQLPFLCYLLYFPKFFVKGNMSQYRAALIYAFALWLIYYSIKNIRKGYYTLMGVGSFFHLSILIYLPFFKFIRTHISTKRIMVLLVVALFGSSVILLALTKAPAIPIIKRALFYLTDLRGSVPFLGIEIMRRIILIFFFLIIRPFLRSKLPHADALINTFVLSILVYIFFIHIRIWSERFSAVFGVVESVLLSATYLVFSKRDKPIGFLLLLMYGISDLLLRGVPTYVS